jgi:hypothetical protein
MNRHEHIATTAAEECVEVAQRITKALRFGWGEIQAGQTLTNSERVVEEFKDLFAMMEWLASESLIPSSFLPSGREISAKWAKVERFMHIARQQGVLTEGK